MKARSSIINDFLSQTDWRDAKREPLAGDASSRSYIRLGTNSNGQGAVLMDADPALGNDIEPFIQITNILRGMGLSAPELFAQDAAAGLLLIEDLGDALFAREVATNPEMEMPLYTAATDVLLDLHAHDQPNLAPYDTDLMTDRAMLAYDWYAQHGAPDIKTGPRTRLQDALHALLSTIEAPSVLIQRDYHSENLIWLPERSGPASVGLLDYQDALLGHPAYDLVSLLKDARRDVSDATQSAMIAYYVAKSGVDEHAFRRAYHVLGLQRNLRIIGVFARLSVHFGKAHYVDLIPRVWGFIERDLAEPVNESVAGIVRSFLPEPTPAVLKELKDRCATRPLQ